MVRQHPCISGRLTTQRLDTSIAFPYRYRYEQTHRTRQGAWSREIRSCPSNPRRSRTLAWGSGERSRSRQDNRLPLGKRRPSTPRRQSHRIRPTSHRLDGSRPMSSTLTITEAAELLGISRNSAYEAARSGELVGVPVLRVGRRLLVPAASLRAVLGLDSDKESEE